MHLEEFQRIQVRFKLSEGIAFRDERSSSGTEHNASPCHLLAGRFLLGVAWSVQYG